jgi:hypothetical protein
MQGNGMVYWPIKSSPINSSSRTMKRMSAISGWWI